MDERNCTVHSWLCWLTERLSTMDSSKKVTGAKSSLGLRFLDFQNKLWQIASNRLACETGHFSVSLSTTSPISFSMHAKYHFPSRTTVCVCVCITSYLQKSNYPKVKLAAEPHCAAHHCKMPTPGCQYWHKQKVEWSYDIVGPPVSQAAPLHLRKETEERLGQGPNKVHPAQSK